MGSSNVRPALNGSTTSTVINIGDDLAMFFELPAKVELLALYFEVNGASSVRR